MLLVCTLMVLMAIYFNEVTLTSGTVSEREINFLKNSASNIESAWGHNTIQN